jgi:hypothetical protein
LVDEDTAELIPVEKKKKLQVGDRVRAVRQSDVSGRWKIGATGTVKRHGGTWVTVDVDVTGGRDPTDYGPVEQIIDEKDMELMIKDKDEYVPTTFLRGDRVRYVKPSRIGSPIWKEGSTGTIFYVDADDSVRVVVDGDADTLRGQWLSNDSVELIEDDGVGLNTGNPSPDGADYDPMPWEAVPAAQQQDNIYQPNHYARYVIEPITFINANKLPFNIGNVIKYACRYDAKNGVEDLRKAIRYLEIQIECLERDKRVTDGEDPTEVWKDKL